MPLGAIGASAALQIALTPPIFAATVVGARPTPPRISRAATAAGTCAADSSVQ
jgi:hypothetical protein